MVPLVLASRQLGGQRVQVRRPGPAELVEPGVDAAQRLVRDRVEAARAVGSYRGESVVPQHLEVLGDGRLGDAELALDHLAERAGGKLAVPDQLQDAAAHRIAEYVERVHQAKISAKAYISKALEGVGAASRLARRPRRESRCRREDLRGRQSAAA